MSLTVGRLHSARMKLHLVVVAGGGGLRPSPPPALLRARSTMADCSVRAASSAIICIRVPSCLDEAGLEDRSSRPLRSPRRRRRPAFGDHPLDQQSPPAAEASGVSRATVYNWLRRHAQASPQGHNPQLHMRGQPEPLNSPESVSEGSLLCQQRPWALQLAHGRVRVADLGADSKRIAKRQFVRSAVPCRLVPGSPILNSATLGVDDSRNIDYCNTVSLRASCEVLRLHISQRERAAIRTPGYGCIP